jgi:hypothetical protein
MPVSPIQRITKDVVGAQIAMKRKFQSTSPTWYHNPDEIPPERFAFGPLYGKQKELAYPICTALGYRVDRRNIQGAALDGLLWVTKCETRQRITVYFRNEQHYQKAALLQHATPDVNDHDPPPK